ncbi:F-box protein-like protein [Tanacetum coccineum]
MDFECVIITQDIFHNLLSTCTLLEKIRLFCCEGLKNVNVKHLLHLRELDIESIEEDDFWEINNVSSLRSFRYRIVCPWREPLPFQMDSLPCVTHLHIAGVIIDNSFFDIVESKFPLLESLTLIIAHWKHENMVITSASLKWLTLSVYHSGPVNAKVNAPRLLSFTYAGNIPRLMFPTIVPEQIKLTYSSWEPTGHSFFLKMRETLNLSSKFEINIKDDTLDSVVPLDIDVDDLRSMVSCPVTDVQLSLETRLDEQVWEQSRFFDAFFSICRPNYVRTSNLVIKKMMEWNKTDIKDVQLKNRYNGKWEALTSSWKSVLDTLPGNLECKLNWVSQIRNV